MPGKVWDEITYPFPNFNGCTVEVGDCISNVIAHIIMDDITYPCCLMDPNFAITVPADDQAPFSTRSVMITLTHCGLATPYGDIHLGQHWSREWLVAWRHQAITWTNVDLSSVKSCGIHLRAISHEILKIFTLNVSLKVTNLRLHPHLPGTNVLIIVYLDSNDSMQFL